jgi:hypothetical protein
MERREFITLLGGAAVWPLAARAQQPARLPTIGYVGANTPSVESQRIDVFVQRLRELGWIEGRTIAIEVRWAEGRNERFAEIAAEFVQLKVDIIVTVGTPAVVTAKQATADRVAQRQSGSPGRPLVRRPGRAGAVPDARGSRLSENCLNMHCAFAVVLGLAHSSFAAGVWRPDL